MRGVRGRVVAAVIVVISTAASATTVVVEAVAVSAVYNRVFVEITYFAL